MVGRGGMAAVLVFVLDVVAVAEVVKEGTGAATVTDVARATVLVDELGGC